MSIKVPYGTTEYQSHNHCQCDFCNSRRNVNAKKWGVSQSAAQMQHSQKRNGCCCGCHNADNAATFAVERGATDFDPAYPAPVNQTALNASRGRNGVPQGDQWTIRNASTRGGAGADASGLNNSGTAAKSKDERAKESAEDLDRLERLLILEHKARVKASMDADALATLRATGSQNRPQVMPADYAAAAAANSGMYGSQGGRAVTFANGCNTMTMSYDNVDPGTVREAYELAHACPVTPPPHCRASHRLQGTMTNIRMVTMDPINPDNRTTLSRLVDEGGKAGTQKNDTRAMTPQLSNNEASASKNKFGNSLAQVVTSNSHPVGAGMVWREDVKDATSMSGTAVN